MEKGKNEGKDQKEKESWWNLINCSRNWLGAQKSIDKIEKHMIECLNFL